MRPLRIAMPGKHDNPVNYIAAFENLGAQVHILLEEYDPNEYDGLLLPGGGDIAPWRFGMENCGSRGIDEELDELQFSIAEAFINCRKPILGICKGHQLLNVIFGGTLVQDMPLAHLHTSGDAPWDLRHECIAEPGSVFAKLYGERFVTNSSHHQALDRIGDGFDVVMRSADGAPEAIAHRTLPILGVQWHPERMCFAHKRDDMVDGSILIQYFLNRCRE